MCVILNYPLDPHPIKLCKRLQPKDLIHNIAILEWYLIWHFVALFSVCINLETTVSIFLKHRIADQYSGYP